MTTSIIETVSSTTSSITFTDVWDRDLLIVAARVVSAGGSTGIIPPSGWDTSFYSGIEGAFWDQVVAGATTHTFTVTGATSVQLLGLHMRSDLITGPDAFPTRTASWGETLTTVGAADALIGVTWVRDDPIDLTTPGFVLLTAIGGVAFWRHDPLQVPVGTSLLVMAADNTPAGVWAWRDWERGAAPPEPAAAVGWGVWIVD